MWKSNPDNVGEFTEKSVGKDFTFRLTKDAWAIKNGFKHEIDVLDGVRFANVLKTVAHVCVDEGPEGEPVMQTWKIKKLVNYKE